MEDFVQSLIVIVICIVIFIIIYKKYLVNKKQSILKKFHSLPVMCYEINKNWHTKEGVFLRIVIKKGLNILIEEERIHEDDVKKTIHKILRKHILSEDKIVDRGKIYSLFIDIKKYKITIDEIKNKEINSNKSTFMNNVKYRASILKIMDNEYNQALFYGQKKYSKLELSKMFDYAVDSYTNNGKIPFPEPNVFLFALYTTSLVLDELIVQNSDHSKLKAMPMFLQFSEVLSKMDRKKYVEAQKYSNDVNITAVEELLIEFSDEILIKSYKL